jgi:transcriptional regulator
MPQRDRYIERNAPVLWDTIEQNPFGLLVAQGPVDLVPTRLPFTLDRKRGPQGTLQAHFANENPIAECLQKRVLVSFAGPHAYVTPTWYSDGNRVPTWNYVAVNVWGPVTIVEDEADRARSLEQLVMTMEANRPAPWSSDRLTADQLGKRMRRITFFEVEIDRLEGYFKLSQDKKPGERQEVIRGLAAESGHNEELIAQMQRRSSAD